MTVVVNKLKFCVVTIAIHGTLVSEKKLNKPNKWLKLKERHLNRAKMNCNTKLRNGKREIARSVYGRAH